MSWLFDRLCELAAADRVEVILAADVSDTVRAGDEADLVDVLLRASHVPQLTVWVLPPGTSRQRSLALAESVDLDQLSEDSARTTIQRLLLAQSRASDAALRIEAEAVALTQSDRADRAVNAIVTGEPADVRRLFATDQARHADLFGHLSRSGLGIAIGGVDPRASVNVPDSAGAVTIVDALVLLRSFAFGVNSAEVSMSALLRTDGLVG